MSIHNGLVVGRFNTSAPTLTTEDDLRELRLDANGRVISRLSDGNDKTLSYYKEDDPFDSGKGDTAGTAGDRGLIVFGRNDTDSKFNALSLNGQKQLRVTNALSNDAAAAQAIRCADDVHVDYTWAEINGVRRITEIKWSSNNVATILGLATAELTRTYTYQVADPFDLIDRDDVLSLVE
jgi:hypothetical protein